MIRVTITVDEVIIFSANDKQNSTWLSRQGYKYTNGNTPGPVWHPLYTYNDRWHDAETEKTIHWTFELINEEKLNEFKRFHNGYHLTPGWMNPPLISCTAGAFVEPETKEIVIKEKPKPKPKPNQMNYTPSFLLHSAGSAGLIGPTLEQIREKYGTGVKFWTNNDDYFSMDSKRQGIQIWTVPKTGYYKFDVYGAGGVPARYGRPSGYSRKLSGYVELNMNEKIHIACGQNAKYHQDQYASFYGGHGGTFVVKEDGTPLIITGGGSGAINQNAKNPVIQTHGNNILTTFNSEGASYSTDMYGLEHKADGHGGDYVHSSGASGAGFYSDGKAFKDRIDQKSH